MKTHKVTSTIIAAFVILGSAFLLAEQNQKDETKTKPCCGDSAQKAEVKSQTLCPIMGNPINKKVYTDYEGQRVYFCCAACIEKFNEKPQEYLKQMKKEGVTPEKTPVKKADS